MPRDYVLTLENYFPLCRWYHWMGGKSLYSKMVHKFTILYSTMKCVWFIDEQNTFYFGYANSSNLDKVALVN